MQFLDTSLHKEIEQTFPDMMIIGLLGKGSFSTVVQVYDTVNN